jgi:hypothetical protein
MRASFFRSERAVTTRELIQLADHHSVALAAVCAFAPAAALVFRLMHGPHRGGNAPWKYFYAVLVYLACVPGIFAAVLTGYTLWFTHENLLDVSFLVYILPIVSMVVTLILIGRNVGFERVPGFDRLSGLMIMIACSFGIALFIQKTRILLVFGGSIQTLFLLAIGIFLLMKWGAHLLFRRREEPARQMLNFPGA